MSISRREFMLASTAVGLTSTVAASPLVWKTARQRKNPKRILILGGTRFLGPAVVEAALVHGHEVILFNRGRSNPHLFPDLEKLVGDRDPDKGDGLRALEGRSFDAVVDTSGHVPRHVRASAGLLAETLKQYLYISSVSVYADQSKTGLEESDPLGTMDDETVEVIDGQTYGPLKALCERSVEEAMPGRATIVRPGLIVGPEDSHDHFTYWPVRIDRGGEVLAPGDPDDPVQYIDVRDLAEFCITCVENNTTGTYNATGPKGRLSIAELLYGCRAITTAEVSFTWVSAKFLAAHKVQPWVHMPVWVPPDTPIAGVSQVRNSKAIAKGLTFRALAETARDTLNWFKTLPPDRQSELRAGVASEKEAEVLAAWHARDTEREDDAAAGG